MTINYDKVEYNWNKIRIEVIIPAAPEIGVAMDLAEVELNKIGVKLPRFLGRVDWNEFIVCGEE